MPGADMAVCCDSTPEIVLLNLNVLFEVCNCLKMRPQESLQNHHSALPHKPALHPVAELLVHTKV